MLHDSSVELLYMSIFRIREHADKRLFMRPLHSHRTLMERSLLPEGDHAL
jgi:hypothetical protein